MIYLIKVDLCIEYMDVRLVMATLEELESLLLQSVMDIRQEEEDNEWVAPLLNISNLWLSTLPVQTLNLVGLAHQDLTIHFHQDTSVIL